MVYPWPHIQLYLLYLANYILYWLAPKPGSFSASYDLSRTTAHTFCCLPWHRPNVKDIVAAVFCVTTKQRYDDDTNYTKWQQLQNTFLTFIDCLPAIPTYELHELTLDYKMNNIHLFQFGPFNFQSK